MRLQSGDETKATGGGARRSKGKSVSSLLSEEGNTRQLQSFYE